VTQSPDSSASPTPLRTRGFWALMATQGFTVLNDNLFKQVVLLLAVNVQLSRPDDGFCNDLQACTGLLFAIPFLLFGTFAGDLADRYSKRRMVLIAKSLEVVVMLLAALAFAIDSFVGLAVVLFLMGTQSALLGPAKYGALVEILPRNYLGRGNGIMQAVVLGAILLGMGSAGYLKDQFQDQLWILGLAYAVLGGIGLALAWWIPHLPPADSQRQIRANPFAPLKKGIAMCGKVRGLPEAIVGHALYWLVGASLVFAWNEMGQSVLGVPEAVWTAKLATLSISTALGCLLAGRLCRESISVRLPQIGGFGMAASFLAVALGPYQAEYIWLCLVAGSFFAGFYIIPLRTLVQRLPDRAHTGRALGLSQFSDWTGIVLASLLKAGLTAAGFNAVEVFWVFAAVMALGTIWVSRRLRTAIGNSV
jgi:acyl-[acyl-carrier-protein]-phospholipid O-acyltransferase / long-chain-fatty-acid--[acyl-carrier-protein] ligase